MSVSSTHISLEDLAEPLRQMRLKFEVLVQPEREALWQYCRRLTGSVWDAEDLVQETLLRVFGSLPNLWQPIDVRAYLFRVASNAWIDQMRRDSRAPMQDLDDHADIPSPVASDQRADLHDAMQRLVQVLPPRQRVVLLLCDGFDFRAREVAAMLSMTEGGVKAALHRARQGLARATPVASDARTDLGRPGTPDPVITRYVEAFAQRDPDAIAALMHEDVVVTIVGCAEEHGRATVRSNSLREWADDARIQWVEQGVLEGHHVLYVFYRLDDESRALGWITTLDTDNAGILAQRQYYFTPEFIQHAASLLGVPAVTHGYQYAATSDSA